eukprot:GFUD01019670.1.p1 GENE.GFUD01019670.1~~GFUD01019670.1.p1  ORF type:complete len:195 (-),score=26.08 GFUD01019670.1:115-699(-)
MQPVVFLIQGVFYHIMVTAGLHLHKYTPVLPQVNNVEDNLDTTGIGDRKYLHGEANLTNTGRQARFHRCFLGDQACILSCKAQWQEGGYCDGDDNCVCTDQDGDVECPVLALWDCAGVMRTIYNCASILFPDKIGLLVSPAFPGVFTVTNCGIGLFNLQFYSEACQACGHSYCETILRESRSWCDEYFSVETSS